MLARLGRRTLHEMVAHPLSMAESAFAAGYLYRRLWSSPAALSNRLAYFEGRMLRRLREAMARDKGETLAVPLPIPVVMANRGKPRLRLPKP